MVSRTQLKPKGGSRAASADLPLPIPMALGVLMGAAPHCAHPLLSLHMSLHLWMICRSHPVQETWVLVWNPN